MSGAFDEIRLSQEPGGTVVSLVFKEKLTTADYEHFVAQVEETMAKFIKPFTRAKVRYFDSTEADQAQDWAGSE